MSPIQWKIVVFYGLGLAGGVIVEAYGSWRRKFTTDDRTRKGWMALYLTVVLAVWAVALPIIEGRPIEPAALITTGGVLTVAVVMLWIGNRNAALPAEDTESYE